MNGDKTTGFFLDGALNGFGYQKIKDGPTFCCNYDKAVRHGPGYVQSSDGSQSYLADYREGAMTGSGIHKVNGEKYIGDFKDQ